MKNLFLYLFSVLLFTLLQATSCSKPIPEPEPTLPTGENTMYYYLDDTLVIPDTYNNGGITTDAISWVSCNPLSEMLCLYTSRGLSICFIDGIQQTGIIRLNQGHYDNCLVNDNHAKFVTSELWNDGIFHTTRYYTQSHTGEVNITFLSPNKRHFIGTFWMDLYRFDNTAVKHVTEGHFNINLETLP